MKRAVIASGRRLEYTLIQTARTNVLFQALPEGVIKVYAPRALPLREIDRMVRERAEALLDMGRAVDQHIEHQRRVHPVTEGAPILIEGVPHTLRLTRAPRVRGEVTPTELRLALPKPDSDPHVRAAIRSVLSERALERIRQRLQHYAPGMGLDLDRRVTIREQKTRWGSCSSKGNLNFNWKLIMAPPQVLDYVVIHELCHLKEFNHSPRFWALVEARMPEYKAWKKWLDDHKEDLYL